MLTVGAGHLSVLPGPQAWGHSGPLLHHQRPRCPSHPTGRGKVLLIHVLYIYMYAVDGEMTFDKLYVFHNVCMFYSTYIKVGNEDRLL